MSKNIRINSSAWALLKHMFYLGTMWKSDAKLYMKTFFTKSTFTYGYKDLLDSGYIEEHVPINQEIISKNSDKSRKELYKISNELESSGYASVNITQKGIAFLANKDDEIYELSKSFKPNKRFRTTIPNLFLNELKKSRVMNIFKAAGALVYKYEKPDLYDLYMSLKSEAPKEDEIYFYTLDEFRAFDNKITPSSSDRYNSSKCYGICISKKGAYMVYLCEPGDNKFISFNNLDSEINIQNKIGHFFGEFGFQYTHLRSPKLASNFMGALRSESEPGKAVDAIVISDGAGMAYRMCIGTKNGKISDNISPDKVNNISLHPNMLCHDSSVFINIFVCPNSEMGVSMLSYLLNHSGSDYLKDNKTRIAAFKDSFIPSESDGPCFSCGKMRDKNSEGEYNDPVVFLPVFETNTLHCLADRYFKDDHEFYKTYGLLTRPGMMEGLARAIRKPCAYFNMKNGIKIKSKWSYDYQGNALGEHKELKTLKAPTKKGSISSARTRIDLISEDRKQQFKKAASITGETMSELIIRICDPIVAEIIENHSQVVKDAVSDMRERFK